MMTKSKAQKSGSWTPQIQKKAPSLAPPPIVVQRDPVSGETETPMPEYTPLEPNALEHHPLMGDISDLPPIQTKLTIGAPGDKYEQEADTVARKVVSQINSPVAPGDTAGDTDLQAKPASKILQCQPVGRNITVSPFAGMVQGKEESPGGEEAIGQSTDDNHPSVLQPKLEPSTAHSSLEPPAESFNLELDPPEVQRELESTEETKGSKESLEDHAISGATPPPESPNQPPLQMKGLTIGAPGDKYEQEADRVAEQVVHQIQTASSSAMQPDIQSKEAASPTISRKLTVQGKEAIQGGTASTDLESKINQAKGAGTQLSPKIRQPMEQAFDADFSGVKVHTGSDSDSLNKSLNSRAFTTGKDIFFKKEEYEPGSQKGQELIAHELTHVVQQNGSQVQRKTESPTEAEPATDTTASESSKQNEADKKKSKTATVNLQFGGDNWSGSIKDNTFEGTIADVFSFKAEKVEIQEYNPLNFDEEAGSLTQTDEYEVTAQQATIALPTLGKVGIELTASNLEAGSTGIDWTTASLKTKKEISIGEGLKIVNPLANIKGASQKYSSEISGELGIDLGSEADGVKAGGSIKFTYDRSQNFWKGELTEGTVQGTIADLFELKTENLDLFTFKGGKQSQMAYRLMVPTATLTLKGTKTTAEAKNLKMYRGGFDWDEATISNSGDFNLGDVATISSPTGKLTSNKGTYLAEVSGNFKTDIDGAKSSGTLTLTYDSSDRHWDGTLTGGAIEASIAGWQVKATEVEYNNSSYLEFTDDGVYQKDEKYLKAASASLGLPTIKDAKIQATAEQIEINREGLDWEKATLAIEKEFNFGDVVKIENPQAMLMGASKNYSAEITGGLGLNLGSENDEVGSFQSTGSLKFSYDGGEKQWLGEVENGSIAAIISDYVKFNASGIHYDYQAGTLTSDNAKLAIEEVSADAKNVTIDRKGIDWDETNLKVEKDITFGEVAKITNASAKIKGKSQNYSTEITGGFALDKSGELGSFKSSGNIKIIYDGDLKNWEGQVSGGSIEGKVSDYIELKADGVNYDHYSSLEFGEDSLLFKDRNELTAESATLTLPSLNNTSAQASQVAIDADGVDWSEVNLTTKDVKFGDFASINNAKANIKGKSENYSTEISGDLGVDIGSPEITEVQAGGSLKVTYNGESKEWDGTFNNTSLKATIANVLNFEASDLDYDRYDYLEFTDDGIFMPENYLNIATASITIPKLNNTNANVDSARIYSGGIDWSTIKAKTNDIPLGEFVSIKGPEATIEGKESHYTTRIFGGAGLQFGKYFDASGQATLLFDRTSGATELKVETAKVTAKGNLDLPGESGLIPGWPLKFEFSYPIVPGAIEATAGLSIYGGVNISLTGEIGKDNPEDPWNFNVNPEAKGIIGTELYAGAAVGSSYILSLGAYLTAAAEAQATGGLKFAGELDYDAEAKKITSNNVTSIYYANAEFIAKVGAKVKATAFYVFEKELYRITFADWNIGSGAIQGNITLDEQGNITFESPEKSGVMGGEIKRDFSSGPQYEVISKQEADQLLRDAAEKIEGTGGEERQKLIEEVRQAYEKALKDIEQLTKKEYQAGEKHAEKMVALLDQINDYNAMIQEMLASGKKTYKKVIRRPIIWNKTKTYSIGKLEQLTDEAMESVTKENPTHAHYHHLLDNLEKQEKESQSVLANVQKAIANVKGLEEGHGVETIEDMEDRETEMKKDSDQLEQAAEKLKQEQMSQMTELEKEMKKLKKIAPKKKK